jgi:hypothetical protein
VNYTQRYLRPLTEPGHYVGTWGSEPVYNQSLTGAVHRWFLTTLEATESDLVPVPRAHPLPPLVLRGLAHGAGLLVLLLALWAGRGPLKRSEDLPGSARIPLEASAVLLLMLLLSPMSSKAHFGVLILPGFCLARAAAASRSRLLWTLLAGAVVLGLLGNKDPLGEKLYTLTLWLGTATLQTLVLLAGCLIALRREGKAQQVPPALPLAAAA